MPPDANPFPHVPDHPCLGEPIMAVDYLGLGPTPSEEDCAQLGEPGYRDRALFECAAFREQLKRTHPVPWYLTGDTVIVIRRLDCGGGTVAYEVAVRYDPTDERAYAYALEVEGACPPYWDQPAADDLYDAGYIAVKRHYAPNAGEGAATELLPFPIV